jgi:uncharacterized membrane protein YagU involved in acid resistance
MLLIPAQSFTAVPKDRDMVFKVLPVIPDSIAPPQVMFSSLGIMSPPSVASVLKQVRVRFLARLLHFVSSLIFVVLIYSISRDI